MPKKNTSANHRALFPLAAAIIFLFSNSPSAVIWQP
jgi:hypothetical protein